MLDAVRAFALQRAGPGVLHQARTAHANRVALLAERLAAAAPTDDSRSAVQASAALAPDVAAALDWAVAERLPVAVPLARSAAVLVEQHRADARVLAAITRAVGDPHVRARLRPKDLAPIGLALCFGDLDVVADVAALARERAASPAEELQARHLSGYAQAYRREGLAALTHFAVAERLAGELGDTRALASVQQGQGIAYGRAADVLDRDAALAAFARALDNYARAADATHVNNVRYMMAMTALDAARSTPEAIAQADACASYARRTGNRHELAHALLARGGLLGGRRGEPDLRHALELLLAVGDLRCLARCYLRLAALSPPAEGTGLLERAADVAASAHDTEHRVAALERLIGAYATVADLDSAAAAFGELSAVAGDARARLRCPAPVLAAADARPEEVARGRARALRTPRR